MEIKQPVPLDQVGPVRDEALKLSYDFAKAKVDAGMTKFRFVLGAFFVLLSIVIFFCGESNFIATLFRPSFPDRAWLAAKTVFVVGCAFAGPDVLQAVISVFGFGKQKGDDSKGK